MRQRFLSTQLLPLKTFTPNALTMQATFTENLQNGKWG